MKRSIHFLIALGTLVAFSSCQKNFLEKPNTTGQSTVETVFSTRVGAEAALANAYRQNLSLGLYADGGISNGTLPGISGETSYGESWMTLVRFINAGFTPTPYESRPAQSPDNLFNNYRDIRRCYIVLENVDKVADMDADTKTIVKAEMKGLIAYHYLGMFIRYGGVPIVKNSLTTEDDLNIPRATLQETLNFIIQLSDEAAAALPDKWEEKFTGRLTKGSALAIKSRVRLYAARPLFNSATPYLNFGSNSNLVCFGTSSGESWNDVIATNEAVVNWCNQNGYGIINTGGSVNTPNSKAFDDYGTATSTPNNKEVLLAFKFDAQNNKMFEFYNAAYTAERYLIDNYGLLTNFLENYYKADGGNQTWPGTGLSNAQPFSSYLSKMNELEPRFQADHMIHTQNAKNNAGDNGWNYNARNTGDIFGKGGNRGPSGRGKGATVAVKFYYKAGSRNWFEFPLFRMPEFYLSLAEAYNEIGNSAKALENLNIVHNRAGLPSVTETDKTKLRAIIQREWAVEFFYENRRFFDVRHWKLDNIGNGIIGGPMRELQFTIPGDALVASGYTNYYDNVVFTAFWDPKMYLLPFPQEEIDKRVLIQNPGY